MRTSDSSGWEAGAKPRLLWVVGMRGGRDWNVIEARKSGTVGSAWAWAWVKAFQRAWTFGRIVGERRIVVVA